MGTVDELRLSWVRGRTQPSRVRDGRGSLALSTHAEYLRTYDAAAAGAWRQPWAGDRSFSHYWALSLGDAYRRATADKAWKRQVPLRHAIPPALSATVDGVELSAQQYLFPTGVGAVVTATVTGPAAADDLLTTVELLASQPVVSMADGPPTALRAALAAVLDAAEREVLGDTDVEGAGGVHPLTVATVTATTDWPADPVEPRGPAHRLLAGLCRLSKQPLTGDPGDLAASSVPESRQYPGTVRLSLGSGCATWSPAQSAGGASTRLRCYHDNLSMAMLHADVLLSTVGWAAGEGGAGLSDRVRGTLAPAVNVLGLLYGKPQDAWSSELVRRRIDQSGQVDAVSRFRVMLGVGGPLH